MDATHTDGGGAGDGAARGGARGAGGRKAKSGSHEAGDEGLAGDRILAFIERIETLEEEKKAAAEGIKEVLSEAKGEGLDAKILKDLVRIRKQDPSERSEEETLLDLYKRAIGMKTE